MDDIKFIKEDVIEAFASEWRSGTTHLCEELGINRSAVCQWPKGGVIPEARRLHLLLNRKDIVQKIADIQAKRALGNSVHVDTGNGIGVTTENTTTLSAA